MTSNTDENIGKRFFSCGSNEVCSGKFCNFFMWLGDEDLKDWNRHLVTHLHRGCVELIYEKNLLKNEATINNDVVQWLSRELAVARDDATWCRKESEFFNAVLVEIAKLSKGVQEMINVINGKKGIKPGRAVRKCR
ncbi:hypothetical protein ACFE04_030081 [Oxalis oulophora]